MPSDHSAETLSSRTSAESSVLDQRSAIQSSLQEEMVCAERARSLYGRGLLPYLTNIINGAVLTIVLWGQEIEPIVLLSWLSALTGLTLIRIGIWRLFLSRAAELAQPRRWMLVYTVGTAMNGATWGSAAIFLYPRWHLPHQLIIAFVLAGMVAGSTATAGSYQPAFRAFALPALVPITVRFLSQGERLHVAMGIMMALFGIAMSRISVLGGETLVSAIRLRLKNEALVSSLAQAHRRLEQANEELEKRVLERTEEARESQRELQKAVVARDDFLGIASHELRMPLSSFRLRTQLRIKKLQSDPGWFTSDSMRKMFYEDDRRIGRLVELIQEMFDVSQLDSGTLTLTRQRVDLPSLIHDVVDRFRPEMEAAGSSIEVTGQTALPGFWDKSRIEQVISNLLSNAIKYAAGKPIRISVESENVRAIVNVIDQGLGINAEQLPRIFDKYGRAASSQDVRGLGLGLYIARRIVQAHGGRISVRSTPGAGSAFTVELPAADRD